MTLRAYILVMLLATLLSWGAFGYILVKIDPTDTNFVGFLFFYLILFLALTGTVALASLYPRLKRHSANLQVFHLVEISYRQGIWLALLFIAGLFLQSKRLLNGWNLMLIMAGLIAIEMFILSSFQKHYDSEK
ncbi:MAG: hypothetical protein HY602_03515 [Parcubacteria group bacterium]|nr:hypothetical protein [Parcubacteria group bacterium]